MSNGKATLPQILSLGKFLPDDLKVSLSESNRKIDPIIEGQLENVWTAKKKNAEEKGLNLYNGISYRLNSFEKQDDKLVLDFATFDYKTRDGLIEIPEYFHLSEEFYRKGCYSISTVKTSDDQYLMVELSGKSMNLHKIENLGGIMETTVDIQNGKDVFKCLYTELEEEGCIEEKDIREAYLRSVFLSDKTNIAFYFEISLNISAEDLLARFKNENKDIDIKSLVALSREKYLTELRNHNSRNKRFMSEIILIA